MELEDIKKAWRIQDKKMDRMLKTNVLLLKKTNYNKIRQEFKSTLKIEAINLWAIPMIILVSFIVCVNNHWEGFLLWNYFALILISIVGFYFYRKRYKKLKSLLKFDRSIKQSLMNLYSFQIFFNKFRKTEAILALTLLIPMFYIFTFDKNRIYCYLVIVFFPKFTLQFSYLLG